MSFKNLIYEKRDNIAVITINRPEVLNALNRETLLELSAALRDAEEDPNIRVIIITGAGEKAFCAGADVREFRDKSLTEVLEFIELGHKVFAMIENLSKPVIALVNGYALGGGLELALACDFIIASTNAKLGQPEVNLGLIPGWGATQKLAKIVGLRKARELILLGETISAEEAFRIGLVDKVVPPERLWEEALQLAKKLIEKSPIALRFAKRAINTALRTTLPEGLEYEKMAFIALYSSEDAREGVRAFLEKRKPVWRGR